MTWRRPHVTSPGAIVAHLILKLPAAGFAGEGNPGLDRAGRGHLDDFPGLGVADFPALEGAVQLRKLFKGTDQLEEVPGAGPGEAELLGSVLVHAGKAEFLEKLTALDFREPEDRAMLRPLHPVHG